MNWEQIEGNWKQMKGRVKQRWARLTNDDLDAIDGKREELVGKIQKLEGIARERAEKDVDEFMKRLDA
jgi:uncharacterized protein YjbJ (UPF0337 family)